MPSSRLLAVTLKMTNYRRPPPGLIRSLPEDTRRQTAAFAKTRACEGGGSFTRRHADKGQRNRRRRRRRLAYAVLTMA